MIRWDARLTKEQWITKSIEYYQNGLAVATFVTAIHQALHELPEAPNEYWIATCLEEIGRQSTVAEARAKLQEKLDESWQLDEWPESLRIALKMPLKDAPFLRQLSDRDAATRDIVGSVHEFIKRNITDVECVVVYSGDKINTFHFKGSTWVQNNGSPPAGDEDDEVYVKWWDAAKPTKHAIGAVNWRNQNEQGYTATHWSRDDYEFSSEAYEVAESAIEFILRDKKTDKVIVYVNDEPNTFFLRKAVSTNGTQETKK